MSTGEFSRATEDAYKKLTEALSHVISSLEAVDGAAGSVSDAVNEVSSYFTSPELASLHGALLAYQSTHPMAVCWLILLATEWKLHPYPIAVSVATPVGLGKLEVHRMQLSLW